jgi:hypothetical protein
MKTIKLIGKILFWYFVISLIGLIFVKFMHLLLGTPEG